MPSIRGRATAASTIRLSGSRGQELNQTQRSETRNKGRRTSLEEARQLKQSRVRIYSHPVGNAPGLYGISYIKLSRRIPALAKLKGNQAGRLVSVLGIAVAHLAQESTGPASDWGYCIVYASCDSSPKGGRRSGPFIPDHNAWKD